jgi:hypothetical protein
MKMSGKKMAPQVQPHPGTVAHSHQRRNAVDDDILARSERTVRANQTHESSEKRKCFYCLEGWVFLGSIGHDGEEVVEAIHCRRCNGTGRLAQT